VSAISNHWLIIFRKLYLSLKCTLADKQPPCPPPLQPPSCYTNYVHLCSIIRGTVHPLWYHCLVSPPCLSRTNFSTVWVLQNSVFFCFRMAAGVKVVVAMHVNCGFSRVAMHELSCVPTGQSRANLDKEEPSEKFWSLFPENANFKMPDKYYANGWHTSKGSFNEHCNFMLKCCSKNWAPQSMWKEYLTTFSVES